MAWEPFTPTKQVAGWALYNPPKPVQMPSHWKLVPPSKKKKKLGVILGSVSNPATRTNKATGKPEAVAGVDNDALREAQLIAAGLLDPQIAEINRAIAAKERQELARAEAFKGVSEALAGYTSGIPEAIRAAYQGSADRISNYAGGLTGELGAAASRAAEEAGRAIATMAPGSPVQVGSEGGALANVTNYLGGYLPASSLAAEAASRLAEASTLRMAGGMSLAQQALDSMQATREEVEELRAKGMDLERTRPAEIQKALLEIRGQKAEISLAERDAALKERALQVQIGQLQLERAKTAQQRAEALTNLTGYLHTVNKKGQVVRTKQRAPGSTAEVQAGEQAGATTRTKISQQGQNARAGAAARRPNAALSKAYRYMVDSNGVPILDANGNRIPYKGDGKGGGLSPKDKSITVNRANQSAKGAMDDFKARIRSGIKTPTNKDDPNYERDAARARAEYQRRMRLNFSTAVTIVMKAVAEHMRALGYTDAQRRKWAEDYVSRMIPGTTGATRAATRAAEAAAGVAGSVGG